MLTIHVFPMGGESPSCAALVTRISTLRTCIAAQLSIEEKQWFDLWAMDPWCMCNSQGSDVAWACACNWWDHHAMLQNSIHHKVLGVVPPNMWQLHPSNCREEWCSALDAQLEWSAILSWICIGSTTIPMSSAFGCTAKTCKWILQSNAKAIPILLCLETWPKLRRVPPRGMRCWCLWAWRALQSHQRLSKESATLCRQVLSVHRVYRNTSVHHVYRNTAGTLAHVANETFCSWLK